MLRSIFHYYFSYFSLTNSKSTMRGYLLAFSYDVGVIDLSSDFHSYVYTYSSYGIETLQTNKQK